MTWLTKKWTLTRTPIPLFYFKSLQLAPVIPPETRSPGFTTNPPFSGFELQFPVPNPVSSSETRQGYYRGIILLPILDPSQQTTYPWWEISWRPAGSQSWQVRQVQSSFRTYSLPELHSGTYQIRVRATGVSGSTSSARHTFVLAPAVTIGESQ